MVGGADDAVDRREVVRRRLKEAMVARDASDAEPLRVAVEAACEADPSMEDIQPARRLLQRLEAEMEPLTFTDVPSEDTERLQGCLSRGDAVAVLRRCFHLENDFQGHILTEYHYDNFRFCQRSKLRAEATSAFLSIMGLLHTKAIIEEKWEKDHARTFFDTIMRRHSLPLPPFSFGIFTEAEALAAREFAERGFFRHYDMYAHAYSGRHELSLSTVPLETPAEPEALGLARWPVACSTGVVP